MKLRSGKTYTIVSEQPSEMLSAKLYELLDHIEKCETAKGTMPKLVAQKELFDFLNENLAEIDPPKDIIAAIQKKSRKLIEKIERLINDTRTTQHERDFLYRFLDTIGLFYDTAEDDYIESYIDNEESWR